MNRKQEGHFFALLTNIFYGANFLFLKAALHESIPVLVVPFVRCLGTLVFISILLLFNLKELIKIKQSHWLLFFVCGCSGASLNQIVFIEGLSRTSIVHASSITLILPVIVILIERIVFKTVKLKVLHYLGIVLGLSGAALLILKQNSVGVATVLGDALVVLNFTLFAIYIVGIRILTKHYSITFILFVVFLIGASITTAITFPVVVSVNWSTISWIGYLALFSTLLFASIFTHIFNANSVKRISPSIASIYIYLQPLMGALWAILLFDEKITFKHFISFILIGGGLYLASFRDVFKSSSNKK